MIKIIKMLSALLSCILINSCTENSESVNVPTFESDTIVVGEKSMIYGWGQVKSVKN